MPEAIIQNEVRTPIDSVAGVAARRRLLSLRYAGFDHQANIRTYRFQRILPGEDDLAIIVTAEMSLFSKHRVRIQDGPTVCLETLAKMEALGLLNVGLLPCVLTDQDMLAHLAAMPAVSKKAGARMKSSSERVGEMTNRVLQDEPQKI